MCGTRSTDLIQGQKLVRPLNEWNWNDQGKMHFDSKFFENLVEIGRRSFMYDFCGRKVAYPSLLLPPLSPEASSSPHLRVIDSHRIKLRRFVPHMCPNPMSPSPWKLLNGMIDILPIQSVKRDHSGDSPREKKLICHETHGFVPYHTVHVPCTRIH